MIGIVLRVLRVWGGFFIRWFFAIFKGSFDFIDSGLDV